MSIRQDSSLKVPSGPDELSLAVRAVCCREDLMNMGRILDLMRDPVQVAFASDAYTEAKRPSGGAVDPLSQLPWTHQACTILAALLGDSILDSLTECLMRCSPPPDDEVTINVIIFSMCMLTCFAPTTRGFGDEHFYHGVMWSTESSNSNPKAQRLARHLLSLMNSPMQSTILMGNPPISTDDVQDSRAVTFCLAMSDYFEKTDFGTEEAREYYNYKRLEVMIPLHQYAQLIVLQSWDGSHVINPSSGAWDALRILQDWFRYAADKQRKPFHIPAVLEHLDTEAVCSSYLRHQSTPDEKHILSYQCLHFPEAQRQIFRTTCHVRMRKASKQAAFAQLSRQRQSRWLKETDQTYLNRRMKLDLEKYLILKVRRDNILEDAFDQLWQRERRELLKPLRVRLGDDYDELGHDQGGVQVEFFNLLAEKISEPSSPFFSTDEDTQLMWFRPGSLEPLYRYELLGLLFGLTLYNGITLPVSLPVVFYKKLMGLKLRLSDMQEMWPDQYKSMKWVLGYEGDIVELDMEHAYTMNANGAILELDMSTYDWAGRTPDASLPPVNRVNVKTAVKDQSKSAKAGTQSENGIQDVTAASQGEDTGADELSPIHLKWPGWNFLGKGGRDEQAGRLTNETRHRYVNEYASFLLDYAIRPQFYAFANGFYHIVEPRAIHLLDPVNLRAVVEGQHEISLGRLRYNTALVDYDDTSSQIVWYWKILEGYTQQQLQRLLEFVTASKRMPPPGVDTMRFIIQRGAGDLESLPTASTCFSTLSLPAYQSRDVMERKMSIALEHGVGFGIA